MGLSIGLADFIKKIKSELVESSKNEKVGPTLLLQHVEVDTNVALEAKAEGKFNIQIIGLGTKVSGAQYHKVKLSFKPVVILPGFKISGSNDNNPGGSGMGAFSPTKTVECFNRDEWNLVKPSGIEEHVADILDKGNTIFMTEADKEEASGKVYPADSSSLKEGDRQEKTKEA